MAGFNQWLQVGNTASWMNSVIPRSPSAERRLNKPSTSSTGNATSTTPAMTASALISETIADPSVYSRVVESQSCNAPGRGGSGQKNS